MILPGLPYDTAKTSINWHGKWLGSNDSIVAFMNTIIFAIFVLFILIITLGLNKLLHSLLIARAIGVMIWLFHLLYKNRKVGEAEMEDREEMQRLSNIK